MLFLLFYYFFHFCYFTLFFFVSLFFPVSNDLLLIHDGLMRSFVVWTLGAYSRLFIWPQRWRTCELSRSAMPREPGYTRCRSLRSRCGDAWCIFHVKAPVDVFSSELCFALFGLIINPIVHFFKIFGLFICVFFDQNLRLIRSHFCVREISAYSFIRFFQP